MKVQYASDLHLEFSGNRDFVRENPLQAAGDVLLLAGDIVPFAVMHKHADFFNYVSDHFAYTYWVPGNHEYYGFDAALKRGTLHEKIRHNVFLVNNTSVVHEDAKFIFSTLWSKINPANAWQIEQGMSDFQTIKYNGDRFTAAHFNQLHEESISFLKQELHQYNTSDTIVVTHHVPTYMHYPDKYKGDALSEAFAIELFDFIEGSKIDYWIYGHHHNNTSDFAIGNTQLLTNQLGYVKYGEHQLFSTDKIKELIKK